MISNDQILAEVLSRHGIADARSCLGAPIIARDFFARVIQEGSVNQLLHYDDGSNGPRAVTPLEIASHYIHSEDLLKLVKAGSTIDVNFLRRAAEIGNTGLVDEILDRGISINAGDKNRYTALHAAAAQSYHPIGAAMVEHLLDKGANPYAGAWGWENTPLHTEISNERPKSAVALISIYKKRNLDLDKPDKEGKTPLHLASMVGLNDVVEALIDNGANIHAVDNLGRTPLHYAALRGNKVATCALIKAGAELNVQDKEDNTPLHLCYSGEKTLRDLFQMLEIFPERRASAIGNRPNHMGGNPGKLEEPTVLEASMKNRKIIASDLIAAGARQDIENNTGIVASDMSGCSYFNQSHIARLIKLIGRPQGQIRTGL